MAEDRVLSGRYRLVSLLGSGGMGEVWRARDEVLDRPVAVKLIRPGRADPAGTEARFRREARLTARLAGHPHIVILYDFGHDSDDAHGTDSMFAVMELVRGRSLSALSKERGPLPLGHAVALVSQAAAGLGAAHAAGIVHRDVKPGNLMVVERGTGDGTLKVLDFGIAAFTDADRNDRITRTGQVVGTPLYMSPEQVRGDRVDRRSDLYSLGAILFLLLTGRPPFRHPNPLTVLRMHLTDPAPTVRALRPEVPDELARLVAVMLAKSADDRPAHAEDVRERLAPFLPPLRPAPAPGPSVSPTLPYTEEALPPGTAPREETDPDRLRARAAAARERAAAGEFDRAARELRDLLPALHAVFGPDHPDTLRARRREAYTTGKGGDHERAVRGFEALLPDLLRLYGPCHPESLAARYYLATNAGRAGNHALAARTHAALVPDLAAAHGADAERVHTTRLYLAFELGESGDPSGAVRELGELVPDLVRARGEGDPLTLRALHYRAAYLGAAGRPAEAVRGYEDLVALHARLHGEGSEHTRLARARLERWRERARR
ncbi:serine/threonine-protein kinase [Nocardiopsis sp. NPDC007018]|uniref:serine/threonine-protein kinase n=1 Tax=Nocardiopsis sp. NPDC007018 TaxID=3155721 RepID=UPI0033C1959D